MIQKQKSKNIPKKALMMVYHKKQEERKRISNALQYCNFLRKRASFFLFQVLPDHILEPITSRTKLIQNRTRHILQGSAQEVAIVSLNLCPFFVRPFSSALFQLLAGLLCEIQLPAFEAKGVVPQLISFLSQRLIYSLSIKLIFLRLSFERNKSPFVGLVRLGANSGGPVSLRLVFVSRSGACFFVDLWLLPLIAAFKNNELSVYVVPYPLLFGLFLSGLAEIVLFHGNTFLITFFAALVRLLPLEVWLKLPALVHHRSMRKYSDLRLCIILRSLYLQLFGNCWLYLGKPVYQLIAQMGWSLGIHFVECKQPDIVLLSLLLPLFKG